MDNNEMETNETDQTIDQACGDDIDEIVYSRKSQEPESFADAYHKRQAEVSGP
ncbi:hypothetical protein LCGC14_1218490 [marine sediment metagenome]|uniref:Uncharacterized protein n=1 Tax=marine sediment metagenome TaxID=412755 RepID=A0A0F9LG11_9ZZZZ